MLWLWLTATGCGEVKETDSALEDNMVAYAQAGEDIYVTIGESVTLSAEDSTGTLEWNLGDGTTVSGLTVEHQYEEIGRYRVVLSATGSNGTRDSDTLNVVVHNPVLEQAPQSNHTMTVINNELWITLPESNSIHRLPLESDLPATHMDVCTAPSSIANFENQIVVTCLGDAVNSPQIALLEQRDDVLDISHCTLPTGYRPSAVLAPTVSDDRWWLIDSATGQLGSMQWGEEPVWRPVGRDLKGLARHSDGTLLMPEFRSTPTGDTNDEDGAVVHTYFPADDTFNTLYLNIDTFGDSDNTTGGMPNLLETVYPSPDGTQVYTPYSHANILRGAYLSNQELTHETSLRGILGRIDWTTQSETPAQRKHFDEKGRATAMVFSPMGDVLYVLHSGVASLSVIDAFSHQLMGSVDGLGISPTDILQFNDALYVYSWLTREIIALSIEDPLRPSVLWQRRFIDTEPLTETLLLGKQIFHDASDTRMTRTGYIACAHCHPAGDHDGQTWDFTDRGEGIRNTTSLWGRGNMAMGPFHWSGNFDEGQDFELDIRLHFGGSGYLDDSDWNAVQDPLGESKADLSPELDALTSYMYSLNMPSSPYIIGEQEQVDGRNVFESLGCDDCHSGSLYTDSSLESMTRHDVGTLTSASGQRLGEHLDGIDTPTLLGVWNSAPYLHDGSATTLEDAIQTHTGYEDIDAETLATLVNFLESL